MAAMEGQRVLERLVLDGRLDRGELERQVVQAERSKENLLDLVIDAGAISEADLLKFAASLYQTQFVGSEKLVKASIDRAVLELVPIRLVERFTALPILLDRKTQTLSVVLADSDQLDAEKQIALVAGVRQVRTYVGRPRTVRALIRRWYYGDVKPLQALLETLRASAARSQPSYPVPGRQTMQDYPGSAIDPAAGDYGMAPESPMPSFEHAIPRAAPAATPAPLDFPGFSSPSSPDTLGAGGGFEDIPGLGGFGGPAATPSQVAAKSFATPTLALPAFDLPDIAPAAPLRASRASTPALRSEVLGLAPQVRQKEELTVLPLTLIETTSVLVALLEQGREELRGHSSQVARLTRKVLERIGVDQALLDTIGLSAQLHDVGKASTYHLTPLNVAQYDGHRAQAQKSYLAPSRLFEAAQLPKGTLEVLAHLYERFDGQGFPDRLTGRDIPLGSRVLAVTESYVDITTNSRNPYRKQLTSKEACDALMKMKGEVFDPTIVDVLRVLVLGDDLDRKLNADRRRVLVVDADPEETTVLEMRLAEHGYDTVVVRDADAAMKRLAESQFDMLISEVELPSGDGFKFLSRVKSGAQPDLPILVLTRRADRESVDRGFALGVSDYLVKPASADVVAAKIRLTLDAVKPAVAATKVRGVSGQLSEMSLPDVVQIFANGRRTGRLILRADGQTGEILFRDGMIFDASFGPHQAAEAVYVMLALLDGEFELDSSVVPETNRIQSSTEGLLLEGMRRLDEDRH